MNGFDNVILSAIVVVSKKLNYDISNRNILTEIYSYVEATYLCKSQVLNKFAYCYVVAENYIKGLKYKDVLNQLEKED